VVVGACPMTAEEMTRVAIDSSGAGAIVLPSLLEEQVILWREKIGQALTPREKLLLERSKRIPMETSYGDAEGPDVIRSFIDGLIAFMERHGLRSIADLQAQRPLDFDSEQDRLNYVTGLSSRLHSRDTSSGDHAIHGDRWGHPTMDNEQ
jgi:hypothetical protein